MEYTKWRVNDSSAGGYPHAARGPPSVTPAVSCPDSACRQDDGNCGPGHPQVPVRARPVSLSDNPNSNVLNDSCNRMYI
jgi:hypothetical protein